MTHSYLVEGMTCGSCSKTVTKLLSGIKGVNQVQVDLQNKTASIEMKEHIPVSILNETLQNNSRFSISEIIDAAPATTGEHTSWLKTYRPILLVFFYIMLISLVPEFNGFDGMRWMSHFMGAFFIGFSFFKLLDLYGFADSYSMYDVIARKWRPWGFIYPFIELLLGIAFLTGLFPLITNGITFAVMSISLPGVLQAVFNKRKIRCACLGAVFNLPMSTITIVEDALMIAMSMVMIISLL